MTDHDQREIGFRLENWGRCYEERRVIGISPTGAFCDRIKREKLGEPPSNERRRVDPDDAEIVERIVCSLVPRDRELLVLCYIRNAAHSEICRKMRFPYKQVAVFIAALRKAQFEVQVRAKQHLGFHSTENYLTDGKLGSTFCVTT